MTLAANTAEATTLLGWLIVVGCLVAAALAGFRQLWIACLLLLAVAIVAASLLL